MRRYFPPANYCIYCGANHCRLTDEHIIPLALNGNLILPKSSCDNCAKVTTRFELIIARDMYGPMRIANNFQTRRKKRRSADIEGSIVSETGEESPMSFPPSLLPSIYMALDFPPPGILTGAPLSGLNPELKVQLKADPEKIAGLAKALDVGNIEMAVMAAWGPFSQLLAKIGHGYIEGIFRGQGYDPLLNDVILGKSDHLSHYVGSIPGQAPEGDLVLGVEQIGSEKYLKVAISLLGKGRLPPYQAIVGRVTNEGLIQKRLQKPLFD